MVKQKDLYFLAMMMRKGKIDMTKTVSIVIEWTWEDIIYLRPHWDRDYAHQVLSALESNLKENVLDYQIPMLESLLRQYEVEQGE